MEAPKSPLKKTQSQEGPLSIGGSSQESHMEPITF